MLYLETKIIPRLTPGEFYFKETNMKKYKRIFSIILLVILVAVNVVPIYGATKTNVYASTEEEFYQYVNEFMKGDYEELIIHIPKNEFKIDEYKKGDNTHNMVEDVLSSFTFETCSQYDEEECIYTLYYYCSFDDGQTKAKKLEQKANQIIKTIIKPNMTDKQKVTTIAKYLKKNCTYARREVNEFHECINNKKSITETLRKYSYLYSAYGALCCGKCVCDGYSRAFNLLARKAGIPSIEVINGNHAWNVYKIGNKYYEIDTTKKQTKGHLVTSKSEFIEKDIYKDLLNRYIVLGTDKVKMKPYKIQPYEEDEEE